MTGRLILAGAPLGDPRDASARLGLELAQADVIAAEDTRRLNRLVNDLGVQVRARVLSCHEHNEESRVAGLLDAVRAGQTVLLVTDAGMPSVSDPGYRLVCAAVAAGLPLTCVPGPSAVTTALALSGLPSDRFCFEGFLPRKAGERARAIADLAGERRTMVFFEAPHRTAATLAAMAEGFGPQRLAALCRELTKTYEEVRRGPLAELAVGAEEDPVRGEVTLVVAGAAPKQCDPQEAIAEVQRRVALGERAKDAAREVAAETGLRARELYEQVVKAKQGGGH